MIEQVEEYKYLGITITSRLKWTTHIDNICSSARKKLGFLKHKLRRSSNELRNKAYKAIVKPSLEYASIVRDPHTTVDIEKIQRLAARFLYNRYKRRDSPSTMLQEAKLEGLKDRRIARIKFLSRLYFSKLGIDPQEYITTQSFEKSRHRYQHYIEPIFARTDVYKYSISPKTIADWNGLPHDSLLLAPDE